MKLKLLAFMSVLAITMGCPGGAYAETILFVSPTRVNLDEKHKIEVINVSNTSDVSRTYQISLQDLAMTEKGITTLKEDFPYSAKKMVRFFPREFTVAPGQSQVIRVMARIPADTPDGEYHVHIKFFEDAQEQGAPAPLAGSGNTSSMRAPLAYSTMLPITVSKGKIETKLGWTGPVLTQGAVPENYHFSTTLTRSGNGQGRSYLEISYEPVPGKPVQIGPRRANYVYREIDRLDYGFDFPKPKDMPPSGQIKFRLLSGDSSNPTFVDEKSLAIP